MPERVFDSGENGEPAAEGLPAEEQVEDHRRVLAREEVALRHGELVEVGQQGARSPGCI